MSADRRRTWRSRGAIVAALALVSAALGILPQLDYLHRLGIDLLLPLRHQLYGPMFPAAESDVVAVVIDEETYGTEPFAATPQVAWTPYLAQVLDAVAAAEPRVIGLDLVYPTSLDRPGLVPGYDKPLLKTFLKIGRSGKLVLGQIRLSQQAINPYRGQIVAAGGAGNLRPLSLVIDGDDVVRRYATAFATEDGGSVPSFAVELVRRAGGTVAEGEFLINYNTGADDIPVFGLADLLACSTGGRTAFFEHFRDKVVIFGTALDVEDRRIPAKRFAMGKSDRSLQPRCGAPFDASRFGELIVRHSEAEPRKGFFSGYLKNPEATADAWHNGWFHTGDVVVQDEGGMLYFVDRKKNIIRRSGENIAAAEVEAVLIDHPAVAQVAVLAVADELREEEVMACIVPMSGREPGPALADELMAWCLGRLAYFKAPGWLLFVDALPTTGTQKVQKTQIFPPGEDPRARPDAIDTRGRKKRQG